MASKVLLQQNLSCYLNVDSNDLHIQTNENGKPRTEGIYFSVSHCRQIIIQAFSFEGELGIDVEYKNPNRNFMALAERYYHAQEFSYLSTLNHQQAATVFYNLWTAKEAVCKSQGGRLWLYLADNYLDENYNIQSPFKGLHIVQLNKLTDYSISLVTQKKPKRVEFIDE